MRGISVLNLRKGGTHVCGVTEAQAARLPGSEPHPAHLRELAHPELKDIRPVVMAGRIRSAGAPRTGARGRDSARLMPKACRVSAKLRQLRTRDEQSELLLRIESFGARLARPSTGLSDGAGGEPSLVVWTASLDGRTCASA